MTIVTVNLSDNLFVKLKSLAAQAEQSVEEYLQQKAVESVERAEKLDATIDYVIEKNQELYQRLAEHELNEQRLRARALLVSSGLGSPQLLEQPQETDDLLTNEQRLKIAAQFAGGKELSAIIIEERERH